MNKPNKIELIIGIISLIVAISMINNRDTATAACDNESVLLVTFGSTYPAPQATFKTIDTTAKVQFKDTKVRWAYTSDFILKRLLTGKGKGELAGKIIDNDAPLEALEKMRAEGYEKIGVQSLHIIPGEEFDGLVENIKVFENAYPDIEVTIGHPLLDTDKDIVAVAAILAQKFKSEIKEGPVCFMGHGTRHHADDRYTKLDAELKKIDAKFYVGTVEGIAFDAGITSIGAIIEDIKISHPKTETVTISPLMSISGDHTNNDMNANTGESVVEDQSWRERLMGAGYKVNSVMKGLGDYPEINKIWMTHLKDSKK